MIERCPECNSELTHGWIEERGWLSWNSNLSEHSAHLDWERTF